MEIEARENFRAAVRALEQFSAGMAVEGMIAGSEAAAKVVADRARQTTAFRDQSGRLRAAIRRIREQATRGQRAQRGLATVGLQQVDPPRVVARDPKAHLIELGHGGPRPAAPHPFLFPAAVESETQQLQEAARAMERAAVKLARRYGTRRRR